MKLKIFSSTQALDNNMQLDEMVNNFCKNHNIINIDCKVDEGEVYVFITYEDTSYNIDDNYNDTMCQVCGYDENDPYRDVIAHEQHLQNENNRK